MMVVVWVLALSLQAASASKSQPPEIRESSQTRIDIDLKEVPASDVLGLVAELGRFNLVIDPGVSCRLTLNVKAVSWRELMVTILRSCQLGEDWMGQNLVRVAPLGQLRKELEERRKYEEQKKAAGPLETTTTRLTYARAKDIAPLLRKFLSPRGEVAFDERTNTLIITDVAR